jgi:uncharacterized protein YggE
MLKKIVASAALLLAPLAVSAADLPSYPFIHVTGSGMTYAQPDIGTVDFMISAEDADPAAARKVVEERAAQVRALVEAQGLPLDDAELRQVRQELRKPRPGEAAPVYVVSCNVHLNVRDLSKWAAIAGGLLGMQNLDQFAVAFDRTDHDKVEAELARAAIVDAREKAENLAAGFGRKLGPVTAVTPGTLKNLTYDMGLERNDFSSRRQSNAQRLDDPSGILYITILQFRQQVDVIYRIK